MPAGEGLIRLRKGVSVGRSQHPATRPSPAPVSWFWLRFLSGKENDRWAPRGQLAGRLQDPDQHRPRLLQGPNRFLRGNSGTGQLRPFPVGCSIIYRVWGHEMSAGRAILVQCATGTLPEAPRTHNERLVAARHQPRSPRASQSVLAGRRWARQMADRHCAMPVTFARCRTAGLQSLLGDVSGLARSSPVTVLVTPFGDRSPQRGWRRHGSPDGRQTWWCQRPPRWT